MSTNDVPGANPRNNDELAALCWAEHEDDSMIFVKGVENNNVIFDMYDLGIDPPLMYSTSMFQPAFEEKFSWKPDSDDDDNIKWVWHDKTPFPWERVMKSVRDGQMFADADDQLSAAARLAKSMKLKGTRLTQREIDKLMDRMKRHEKRVSEIKDVVMEKRIPRTIMQRIQGAINELRRPYD